MATTPKDSTGEHRWCAGCGMMLHLLRGLWSCKTTDCPGNLSRLFPAETA